MADEIMDTNTVNDYSQINSQFLVNINNTNGDNDRGSALKSVDNDVSASASSGVCDSMRECRNHSSNSKINDSIVNNNNNDRDDSTQCTSIKDFGSQQSSPRKINPSIIVSLPQSRSGTPKLKSSEESLNSKNQSVVKNIYENPSENALETDRLLVKNNSNGSSFSKPESKKTSTTTLDKSRKKSDSEEEHVYHVQFQNDICNTLQVQNPSIYSSKSESSSSSSSESSSGSESIEISETKPPDGGWGWVVVAASFMVNLIADGVTFSFGVIFVEFLKYFGESKSKTSWIGSLFMATPLLSGPIASFLTDRYGCRKVTIVGAILACIGFVISSFVDNIEILFLTFGGLAGFGLSLCYVASVVIVAYYFDSKRSFATGLAVCGSGIGTMIFAPLTQFLLDEYGWRGTTLILAGIFLNLIVCGALMRDLPWTRITKKKERKKRKERRRAKRMRNSSSVDTFSVSNSTNTASVMQNINENKEKEDEHEESEAERLFSSLVDLPTFVNNGEKVPVEVLELLSSNKNNVYNVLLQNYPGLLAPSRSFSDSGRLNELHLHPNVISQPVTSEEPPPPLPSPTPSHTDAVYLWWLNRNNITPPRMHPQKKIPPAYLKDLKLHRLSLTYRGAMLNINRYRLRASSCPDIYRNSMTTIAKEKGQWYSTLWDFWDLVVDIIDFSHFSDPKFLLFAISNFLLYTWYDVPYVYLADYAVEMNFSQKDASFLVSMIGIVNMVGEIILGWAGDRPNINAGLIYAACMGFCGLVMAVVPLIHNYWGLCVIAALFGLFIAANYSLTCIILVELITIERFTNAYGLLLLVQGVANLIGPPLAGWISDVTGNYNLSFYLAGIFIMLSGLLLVIIPSLKRFRKFQILHRNLSEEATKDSSNVDEPKFHKVLIACVTGDKQNSQTPEENHV